MITTELINFIKHHIVKETPEHMIQNVLHVQGGWSHEDIEEAFLIVRFGYPYKKEEYVFE